MRGADIFWKFRPSRLLWEPYEVIAASQTAVGNSETNCQRRTQICQRPLIYNMQLYFSLKKIISFSCVLCTHATQDLLHDCTWHLQLGITCPNQYSTQGFSAAGSTLSNRDSDSGSTRTRPPTSYKKIGKSSFSFMFLLFINFLTATSFKKIGKKVI